MVAPVFQGLGDERWREAQTLMLQAEVDRLGDLDHTSLVLKVSRLAAHVHPAHLHHVGPLEDQHRGVPGPVPGHAPEHEM